MAGSTENTQNGLITGINVTPLVDVVLVLLIIFMATAPLLHRRSLNVNVPKAAVNEKKATAAATVFMIASGELFLDERPLSLESLVTELRSRQRLDPALHVSVAADESLAYGRVVGLLDAVRGAGIKKVALEVRSK